MFNYLIYILNIEWVTVMTVLNKNSITYISMCTIH